MLGQLGLGGSESGVRCRHWARQGKAQHGTLAFYHANEELLVVPRNVALDDETDCMVLKRPSVPGDTRDRGGVCKGTDRLI